MTFAPMSIPVLETERLVLRDIRESDFGVFNEIYENEETARFIGGVRPRWQIWRQMAAMVGHWQLRGFGFWMMEEKSTGEPIGWCGNWEPEGWPEPEVGYALITSRHGRGYVTEASIAALLHAYGKLKWPTAISLIDTGNAASQKVAQRLGAVREGSAEIFDQFAADVWRHLPPAEFMQRFGSVAHEGK